MTTYKEREREPQEEAQRAVIAALRHLVNRRVHAFVAYLDGDTVRVEPYTPHTWTSTA
jgi:hypothetical protein